MPDGRPAGYNALERVPGEHAGISDEFGNLILDTSTDGDITGDALTTFSLYRVWNGSLSIGPPDPSSPISVGNPLPYFDPPVDVSGGSITWWWVVDSKSPSGFGIEARMDIGAATDDSYIQITLPVGGSSIGSLGNAVRTGIDFVGNSNQGMQAYLGLQYLDASGTPVGSATEDNHTESTSTVELAAFGNAQTGGSPPVTATRLRVRLGARRNTAPTTLSRVLSFHDLRNDAAATRILVGEGSSISRATKSAGLIDQVGGKMTIGPDGHLAGTQIALSGGSIPIALYGTGPVYIDGGQIQFPATQVASADVNTLDDYEEGTWTPVASYATAGTSSWAVTTQVGRYTKIGNRVFFNFFYQGVPTNGTGSGNLQITGLPFTSINVATAQSFAAMAIQGYTKANYTMVVPRVGVNVTLLIFDASGSGQAGAVLATADIPSGGTVILKGAGHYEVAT